MSTVSAMRTVKRYFAVDDGATAVEYGLIASLVSMAFILALNQLGISLPQVFLNIAAAINAAVSGGSAP